jgi:hypothetical protein
MLWVAVAAGIILIIAALWKWGSRPRYHRRRTIQQLGQFVDGFLVQMAPGSTLIAEREGDAGFLQLAMLSASGTWQSVEFGLPDTDWSRGHFDRVLEDLRHHGFPVQVEAGTSAEVTRFLRIAQAGEVEPLGRQLHRMLSVTHRALEWPADQRFVVHFEGALRQDRAAMPTRVSGDTAV